MLWCWAPGQDDDLEPFAGEISFAYKKQQKNERPVKTGLDHSLRRKLLAEAGAALSRTASAGRRRCGIF